MKEKVSILIVNEEENFCKAISKQFEQLGYEADCCRKDGSEVIKMLNSKDYGVIILEAFMAGMDALDVIEYTVKNNIKKPFTVVFSSVTNGDFEAQIIEAGADYYFIKPVDPEKTAVKIDRLMKRKENGKNTSLLRSDEDVEITVSDIMRQIGVPAHIKGYQYLRTSILHCIEDETMLGSVTKILYPTVAKEYHTTPSRVERAIRHAIEVAWDRGDIDVLSSFFGYTIDSQRGKPTNSEFIAMISDKIILSRKKVS